MILFHRLYHIVYLYMNTRKFYEFYQKTFILEYGMLFVETGNW